MSRPTVGITTGPTPFSPVLILLSLVVLFAGGRPVRLRPLRAGRLRRKRVRAEALAQATRHFSESVADELGSPRAYVPAFTAGAGYSHSDVPLSAILVSGGSDISPTLVSALDRSVAGSEPVRDVLELHLVRRARRAGVPVLGICRGAQLLSVAGRGSLYESVQSVYPNARYPRHPLAYALFRKRIEVSGGSLLRRLTDCQTLWVNSLHRQAIDGIGVGLEVTAREDNGVVQAVEDREHPFYLGVQFHPELLVYSKPFRRIFGGLVDTARVIDSIATRR